MAKNRRTFGNRSTICSTRTSRFWTISCPMPASRCTFPCGLPSSARADRTSWSWWLSSGSVERHSRCPPCRRKWRVTKAKTAAIDCCSCLSHDRNRRSLRRQALPVPPSAPCASINTDGLPRGFRLERLPKEKSNICEPERLVVVIVVEWLNYSTRIIIVGRADLSENVFRRFSSVKCVFLFRVDFLGERNTFRTKIMEIVLDFFVTTTTAKTEIVHDFASEDKFIRTLRFFHFFVSSFLSFVFIFHFSSTCSCAFFIVLHFLHSSSFFFKFLHVCFFLFMFLHVFCIFHHFSSFFILFLHIYLYFSISVIFFHFFFFFHFFHFFHCHHFFIFSIFLFSFFCSFFLIFTIFSIVPFFHNCSRFQCFSFFVFSMFPIFPFFLFFHFSIFSIFLCLFCFVLLLFVSFNICPFVSFIFQFYLFRFLFLFFFCSRVLRISFLWPQWLHDF